MKRLLATAAAIAATLVASTASDAGQTSRRPPSSSLSGTKVTQAAQLVTMATQTRYIRNRGYGSMRPVFDTNSLLLIEEPAFESLRIGDIVVFRNSAGNLVTHRIIEQRGNRFWTMGDNNARPDSEYVTAENFKYRVWGVLYSSDYTLGTTAQPAASLASTGSLPDGFVEEVTN